VIDETRQLPFPDGRPDNPVALEPIVCAEREAARLDAPAAKGDGNGGRPTEVPEPGASGGVHDHGDGTRHARIVLSSGYGTRGLELQGKTILVTGGTGSFGTKLIEVLLERHDPATIRVYSRDELKQSELRRRFADDEDRMRYLIGDVRDLPRLTRATRGVDIVVHAAALKQVPACEYNPFEAVQTNVLGAENVVAAAIENDVPLTMALSSDKAVNPVNLYGATKLCAEKIVTQGNAYSGDSVARFASVRYGNVVGSRGSVIPLFKAQSPTGVLTITDERMTRFWITLEQAVEFVLDSLGRMGGGEVFVPRIPSMRVVDIAEALAPDAERRLIGIRPGEKLHEVLLTEDEARHTLETDRGFVILPEHYTWPLREVEGGRSLPPGFHYSSDQNDQWLDVDQLREMASDVRAAL
jgi:UDP-N-acetylglucosamine 4,6-dehydratase